MALVTAGSTFAIHWYRHRLVRSDADLIAFLPGGDGTKLFIDVGLLRRAGILDVLAPGKLGEDPDYKRFQQETHFDYRRDLDAIEGSFDGERSTFLLRGRFDQRELWKYAVSRGGQCDGDWCRMPASTPGRWTSFALPQSDVLSLAVGPSPSKQVCRLERRDAEVPSEPPSDPVWLKVSQNVLRKPAELPLPLQIVAVSLQSANPVILSAGMEDSGVYLFKLDAQFPNQAAADTIRNQLELETKSLSLAIARQHGPADPKDFGAMLASGTFRVSDAHMLGRWVIRPELLHSLE